MQNTPTSLEFSQNDTLSKSWAKLYSPLRLNLYKFNMRSHTMTSLTSISIFFLKMFTHLYKPQWGSLVTTLKGGMLFCV
jgi:hypothetical protein